MGQSRLGENLPRSPPFFPASYAGAWDEEQCICFEEYTMRMVALSILMSARLLC
jgi:hypothetical protein